MTRRKLDSFDKEVADLLQKCVAEARLSRQPSVLQLELAIDGTPTRFWEMCLPLADDGSQVDTLLFISYPVKEA